MIKVLASHQVADTTLRYLTDDPGRVELEMHPTSLASSLSTRRQTLKGEPEIDLLPGAPALPAIGIDSLVHLKIVGHSYPGAFAQGRTMRNAPSIDQFKFHNQRK